jgi:esterase/lipase superfamily enzyme
MFMKSRWYSSRLQEEVTLARWGEFGQPVLIFPTAGGDAEEIERFLMIRALEPLITAGRIKVYSCDSVAGRAWFHTDCRSEDIPIWTTGASIGAFHAAAVVCRFPDVFHRALPMSGTFNLMRFSEATEPTDYFRVSSPLYFVPHLEGRHLDVLRTRRIHFVTGEGKYENIGESWGLANVLGAKGIPNFVDSWGPDWSHDWVTWRAMMPKYLDEWTK